MTACLYEQWHSDAVWFFGTGLSLIFVSAMNWAHIGLAPCNLPTAPVVRYANTVYALFGLGSAVAVPEPQTFVLVGALMVQAVASRVTLIGPDRVRAPALPDGAGGH